jgi:hypothetical protein
MFTKTLKGNRMLITSIRKIANATWSKPLFIFAIMFAALGIFLPKLGYYQDDWNLIYLVHTQGPSSIWSYYFTDARPLTAWVNELGFLLFGLSADAWHFASFILRYLTVIFYWLCLKTLWPEQKKKVFWMTLFFSTYPLFSLHGMAVTYFTPWFTYLLFASSLYLMILALKRKGRNLTLWILSVLLTLIHMLTVEYYVGLELIRPIIIAFFIPKQDEYKTWLAKGRFILQRWSPYLLGLICFIYYRIILVPQVVSLRAAPRLLHNLIEEPLKTSIQLLNVILQDLLGLTLASWPETLRYELLNISNSANIKILSIMLICGVGIYLYMKHSWEESSPQKPLWIRQSLLLGGSTVLLGTIPTWVIGAQITTKNPHWSSRFGLPATFGLAILVVVVLELALKNRYHTAVFSLLIALAIGWHVNNLNNFRWSWEEQVEFYRQLLWRAPSIEKGTVLLSAGEFLNLMGDYPTAFAINTIYTYTSIDGEAGYWYADIEDFQGEVGQDFVYHKKYTTVYEEPSSNSLIIQFKPEKGQCLWILTPEIANRKVVHPMAVEAAQFTKLMRIKPTTTEDLTFLEDLLNGEHTNTQTWCYFYQKGDLAAQYHQWSETISYWEEATRQDFRPSNGIEFIPFIKAYLFQENYDQAISLTIRSKKTSPGMKPILCNLWREVENSQASNHAFVEALSETNALLGCGK